MLDASVAVAWCFEDETTAYTERILDAFSNGAEAMVPAIWPLEIANAMLVAERRKRITAAQVTAFMSRIAELPVTVEVPSARSAFTQILPLAREHDMASYDAAYLELAIRHAIPLATVDDSLRRAAKANGISPA